MLINTANAQALSQADISAIVATTTSNYFSYISGILPELMVFAVIVGVLFFVIRWVWSAIRGHGFRP